MPNIDEHRIFRQNAKLNKNGEINYSPYNIIYERYYNIYNDYLTNLLINLIEYENVPQSLNVEGLEFMLRYFGYANIVAVDKENIFVEGITDTYPNFNLQLGSVIGDYGESKFINDMIGKNKPVSLNRFNVKQAAGKPVYVTVPNKFSFYTGANVSDADLINQTAATLAEIKASIISNIRQQKTPFIGFTKDGNLTSKIVWDSLEQGKPFINIDSDAFDDVNKVIQTFPVQTPNLAPTLQDSWSNAMSEFLTLTGIRNVNIDKKERLITAEATSNDELVNNSLNIYIKARQNQLDLINEAIGTNMKVNINEDVRAEAMESINESESESDDSVPENS